jgi:hypothetical protein
MMKYYKICRDGFCCPEVKISDKLVDIWETGNICVLLKNELEILKENIINKEI